MKTIIRYVILVVFTLIALSSCSESFKLKKMMSEFVQSQIQIPDDLQSIYKNTLSTIEKDSLMPLKLIVYYDSLDCSSCRISHFMDLYPLYKMADTSNFSIITIFSPKKENLEDVKLQISMANYPERIYLDTNRNFCKLNESIPNDHRFHSFMLNDDGRPIFVGNPLGNTRLMQVFIKTLQTHNL